MIATEPQISRSASEDTRLFYDAERLLAFAEEMQNKCEHYQNRILAAFFCAALILILASTGCAYGINHIDDASGPYLTTASFWLLSCTIISCSLFIRRTRIYYQQASHALTSSVEMLRELEFKTLEGDQLTTFEKAHYRIRLARFGMSAPRGMITRAANGQY